MYLRAAPVPTCRRINVNLVCKREVVGPGLKSVGVVGPKISTDVCTYSTGLKVSSPESLFIYTQIFLFMKSHHFVKCSYLTFLHITGYTNISWRPRNPRPRLLHHKIWMVAKIDAFAPTYIRILSSYFGQKS